MIFPKGSLNVEIQTIGNTSAIAEAVASINADIGFSAISLIAVAYKKHSVHISLPATCMSRRRDCPDHGRAELADPHPRKT